MSIKDYEGRTVVLTDCPSWNGAKNTPEDPFAGHAKISGTFTLESYEPYEPSNYVYEAGWWIIAADGITGYFVADDDLREHGVIA